MVSSVVVVRTSIHRYNLTNDKLRRCYFVIVQKKKETHAPLCFEGQILIIRIECNRSLYSNGICGSRAGKGEGSSGASYLRVISQLSDVLLTLHTHTRARARTIYLNRFAI